MGERDRVMDLDLRHDELGGTAFAIDGIMWSLYHSQGPRHFRRSILLLYDLANMTKLATQDAVELVKYG